MATTRRRLAIGDTRRSCAVGMTLLLHVRERDREGKKKKLSRLTYPIMLHSAAQMFTQLQGDTHMLTVHKCVTVNWALSHEVLTL